MCRLIKATHRGDHHMPDTDSLIREANRLMDEGDWDRARDLYREAFIQALPEYWVSNLRFAEEYDSIHFWEVLLEKYPDSFAVYENLIIVLAKAHRVDAVVRLCTELLQAGSAALEGEYIIRRTRWFRFMAALRAFHIRYSGSYKTVPEDFTKLWELGSRREIIQALTTLADPTAIPMLELLAREAWLPTPVKQLIEMKIHELQKLADVLHEYDSSPLDNGEEEASHN